MKKQKFSLLLVAEISLTLGLAACASTGTEQQASAGKESKTCLKQDTAQTGSMLRHCEGAGVVSTLGVSGDQKQIFTGPTMGRNN